MTLKELEPGIYLHGVKLPAEHSRSINSLTPIFSREVMEIHLKQKKMGTGLNFLCVNTFM